MILKELMRENRDVLTRNESARIFEIAELMRANSVGSIVIVDDSERVVGIVTDRDIAMCLALGAATPDSYVSEAMSREVHCIDQSMTMFEVTRFIKTVEVRRLPVIDGDRRLVGIISIDDIMALLSKEMYDTCSSLAPRLGHMV